MGTCGCVRFTQPCRESEAGGAWRADYQGDDQLMPKCVLLQRDNIAGLKREITREIASVTLKRGNVTFSLLLIEKEKENKYKKIQEQEKKKDGWGEWSWSKVLSADSNKI